MNDINIITPPDKLFDKRTSLLLICPSRDLRLTLENILKKDTLYINIYLYELNTESLSYEWLLDVHRLVDICVIELQQLPPHLRCIESYLISFPNTYYINYGENVLYNKISNNRIHQITECFDKLRGFVEKI